MTTVSRRALLQSTSAAAFSAKLAGMATWTDPPNIVLIFADDLGYGDLSSFGAHDLRTPHIDSLASSGVRFSNFYTNSPVCSPTRAALLSGMYPDLIGVPGLVRTHPANNWGYLAERAVLLPRMLKAAGYHSALIGKWNLGLKTPNLPNERGFDYFHGFLGDMMDDYYTHARHQQNYMREDVHVIAPQGHATDLFTDWAINYLTKRAQDHKRFFLYLAYNAPHVPIQPPDLWLQRVRAREPQLDLRRAKMVALIEHLDACVGRVLAVLKQTRKIENTVVIFTSDNGGQISAGASCGAWRGGKEDMYEGGIRVPMCVCWPKYIQPGSICNEVAMTMDLTPTIAEIAGVPVMMTPNGRSLFSLLQQPNSTLPERDLVWMRRDGNMRSQGRDYYAYRSGGWKILQNNPFEPMRLFNLLSDPGERKDLSAQEPERYRDLIARLMLHIQAAGQVAWQEQQ